MAEQHPLVPVVSCINAKDQLFAFACCCLIPRCNGCGNVKLTQCIVRHIGEEWVVATDRVVTVRVMGRVVCAKTVSGLLIPSPPGDTTSQFVNCQLCPRPVCPGRRAPYDPAKWKEYNL
ncbi:hypothetical protein Pelo_4857 [Pelomyxa schiedti]|nr:hypothetical protein Pelo_4857 [Pelomyxa schiedti]